MKNKIIKLCFLTGIVLLLCGCWNYSELNELAITTSLGIDKKDNEYLVSLQIANAKSAQISAKEGQSQTTVLEAKGKTISEALENIDLKSPKQIYINHLTAIVMSEEVAKEGIAKVSDFLLREPESRKKFYLLITKDTDASDVLKILTPLESLPSQSIASNIQEAKEYQALVNDMIYSIFINDVLETGINPVVTSITIEGEEKDGQKYETLEQSKPDAVIKMSDLGIFKKDKLLGFVSGEDSEGINIVLNKVNRARLQTKCGQGYIVSVIDSPKTKMKTKLVDNEPQIELDITGRGSIVEVGCKTDLTDPNTIEKIQKDMEKQLKQKIQKAIKTVQEEYKSDIFGFGLSFYHHHPKYYKTIKNDWDKKIFPNIDVKVKTSLDINIKGSLEQSIKEEES